MKTRSLHTKIWQDSWFVELPTKSKFLFIYLLTNSQINLVGIYELSDRIICFDTGLSKSDLTKCKKDLKGKIIFSDNWVKILNIKRYDNYGGGLLIKARDNQLSDIPEKIIEKLNEKEIPYHRVLIPPKGSNSNSNSNSNKEKIQKKDKSIDSLTDEFCAKVARNYKTTLPKVLSKKNDLILYCRSTGKRYKDYQATLQAWVRKDLK